MTFGTRDSGTIRAYVRQAHASDLRSVLDEAKRDHDQELVDAVESELRRRGL